MSNNKLKVCLICDKLYDEGREWTCSDGCYEALVSRLIAEFGKFKKVVRQTIGVAYRVPTRDILDKGLREELGRYPVWSDD